MITRIIATSAEIIATSADVHDSPVFEQLLNGDEPFVYADKAYGSKERRKASAGSWY